MGPPTNLKRKHSTLSTKAGAKKPRLEQCASSVGEAQLCIHCRDINFDEIFRAKVKSCGRWRLCGKLVQKLEHLTLSISKSSPLGKVTTCDLCQFFRTMAVAPDACHLELHAYSTRAAFKIPCGLVPDSVMLAVVPGKRSKTKKFELAHPLSSGKMIIECDNSPDRIAGRQIDTVIDFDVVRSWLEFCDAHHTQLCRREAISSIPSFSVIDCVTRKVEPWSRLDKPADFVALSYVWGDSTRTCNSTTSDGCLPNDIPQVIADAMEATTKLGFKYIWIDRYCIPQDNSINKHIQIQNMKLIYGSSVVTIIAAAGNDPSHGLPGLASTPRSAQLSIHIGTRTLIATKHNAKYQVHKSQWNKRAWTYQEGLLSKRRLVFTDQLVYFQCCGMHCIESIAAPLALLHTDDGQRMRDAVDMARVWPLRGVGKYPVDLETYIVEYTRRMLTYPSDALHAFEGILHEFATREYSPAPSICCIPLFKSEESGITASLVVGLSWRIYFLSYVSRLKLRQWRRRGFPSWSWTGWDLTGVSAAKAWFTFNFEEKSWPTYGQSKFKKQNTLKPVTALASFKMQFSDGTVLPWRQASSRIMAMAASRNAPSELLVTGFAADMRVKHGRDRMFCRGTDVEAVLNRRGLSGVSLFLDYATDIARWAEILGVEQPRPADDGGEELFYDLRLVCLGYMQETTRPKKFAMVMVLHRPEGSETYERLTLVVDTMYYHHDADLLRDMRRGVAPEGWVWRETRIS